MRRLRTWLAAAVAVCLCELLAFGASTYLSRLGIFYVAPDLDGFERYAEVRDPRLGWVPSAGGEVDGEGARLIPGLPPGTPACVSAYGDSFTWGAEVSAADSWANQLSILLGCRVANFGISGYGTDQAVIRFEGNAGDQAPVTMLVVLSENLIRNLSRNAGLLYPGGGAFKLKPRFLLQADGTLALLPMPMPDRQQMQRIIEDPAGTLPDDYFVPEGPSGKVTRSFPYTLALVRGLGYFQIAASLRREPWYADFYRPDHPSGALPLTHAIIKRFADQARERGKRPLVVLMPTARDVPYHRRTGRWPYQALADRLQADGLAPVDLGPVLESGDECRLFINCLGHLTAAGGTLVAETLAAKLGDLRQQP